MIKSYKVRIVFYMVCVEWLFFGCWYLISGDGVRSIVRLKRECMAIEKQVKQTEADVSALRLEYQEWRTNPFYVERYARKKLSMSYPGDEVIVV